MIETIDSRLSVQPLVLAAFQSELSGEALTAQNTTYDDARMLVNRRFDNRPEVIVRCHTSQDVAVAVMFARDHDIEIAVRSGGHSLAGHSTCDGGMLLDLSQMKQIDIDPARRLARVQPGVTNGELVLATQAHGLATTTGTCATVGMGGSTLGGGIGWLMGRFGMTIDNVLACEIVTADGDILTTSAEQHPDLFWALRGGGGNFGVVTSIVYRLHQLGPVLGGAAIIPMALAPAALRLYRDLTATAPDELIANVVLTDIPEFGPAMMVQTCYSGEDLAEGERVLEPVRRSGLVVIDAIAPRDYTELYMMLTPPLPHGVSFYDAAYALRQPSDDALDALADVARTRPTPLPIVNIHQIHGLATRVALEATAFALREQHYAVVNVGMWIEGTGEAETRWAREGHARMAPFASRGLYVNFMGDEGHEAIRAAYRGNYNRLAAIKGHYDPGNLFRRNQNIRPNAGR